MRTLLISFVLAITFAPTPVAAGTSTWSENFEGVACGALPAGWMDGAGNDDFGAIWQVGDVVCEGDYALGLCGLIGAAWAALVSYPISPVDNQAPSLFSLEFDFRGGSEALSGPYPGRVYALLSDATDWQGNERMLVSMAPNGDLSGTGLSLGNVDLLSCHRMRIDYTRIDAANVQIQYWLDGADVGTTTVAAAAYEDNLVYLQFGSWEGSAWVDDVDVTVTTTTSLAPETWGRVKGSYHD